MIIATGWVDEAFFHGIFSMKLEHRCYLRTPKDFKITINLTIYGFMREKDGRYLSTREEFKTSSSSIVFFYLIIGVPEYLSSSLSSKIYPSRLQVTFNFLNQLTSLDLSLCGRFQSLDELPTGLQAMDASNTSSLVWIFTGLNWELSKQLQCFGCSKVLKKNRTSNPKNKLLNVSLLSLFLFDRIWFLDQNSLLMILMY